MLISDSNKFVFVHNYKVAGSSIRAALRQYASSPLQRMKWINRQLARIGIINIPEYPVHSTAAEIRERFPDEWADYFTFGFVRNPWDWQVSLYFYMLENEDHHQHELICSMSGFNEYIEWRVHEDKHLQSEFFCSVDGKILVDYVGRLETIKSDFDHVCSQIGAKADLPHKNSSSHKDYRVYYDDHTRKLVKRHFEEDIRRFGYNFNGIQDSHEVTSA